MTLPGYCKQALTDLPTSNLIAGANFFVINEGRWYYCDGIQWIKHSENLSNTQIQNFTNNITAVSNLSDYIDSSLSNQSITINGLQNQITNFSNSVNGTLSNYQSMITALQDDISNINNSGNSNNSNAIDYTELLLKFNGVNNGTDFVDDSKNNYLIIPSGNPIISTNNYKFGGSSLYLNGSSALNLPSINFKTNWTIETWFATSLAGYICIICQDVGGGNEWTILVDPDGTLSYYNAFYPTVPALNDNTIINNNQWHHFALVRNKSSIYWYIDGLLSSSKNNLTNFDYSTITPMRIGFMPSYGRYFNGYLDNLRISSKAIYTPELYPLGFNVPDENFQVTQIQSPN